jgi:protein-L-isoaspartate(D-aspartate) O-methyltransferase
MGRTPRCAALVALAAFAMAACVPRRPAGEPVSDEETRRRLMVETQIRERGISDPAVLAAMMRVRRHLFVPEPEQPNAYDDGPLPIGYGQTISQPYIVAYMSEALDVTAGHRVLEIGTGSGYQAAVLAEMGCEVFSIEIVPELAERARSTLAELGYVQVHVRHGDGYLGWPEEAPFDRVILTAAPRDVPQALIDQLAVGGVLVAPVGGLLEQTMTIVRKTGDGVVTRETIPVRFVPMVGGRGS